jgi:hypothetical protein
MLFTMLFLIPLIASPQVSAYKPSTHDALTTEGIEVLTKDGFSHIATEANYYKSRIDAGSEKSDDAASRHYHDHLTHRGIWFLFNYEMSAAEYCQIHFEKQSHTINLAINPKHTMNLVSRFTSFKILQFHIMHSQLGAITM